MDTAALPRPRRDLRIAAVVLTAALGAFTLPLGSGPLRRGFNLSLGYPMMLQLGLVDALLFGILVVGVVPTVRRLVQRHADRLVVAGSMLVAALAASFVVHPVDRGLFIVLRLAAAVVLADAIVSASEREDGVAVLLRPLGRILVCVAAFEWLLGVYQVLARKSLGVWVLGERVHPLYPFGPAVAPAGTFFHAYVLSGFVSTVMGVTLALALWGMLRVRWALLASALAGSAAMLTYARVSLVGLVMMSAMLVAASRRSPRARRIAAAALLCMSLSMAATFVVDHGGWATKNLIATDTGDISTGRVALLRENLDVFARHPLTGVGVGRYALALFDEGRMTRRLPKPPHMIPMAALSEAGLLAVPALVAHVLAGLVLVWRRRWVALVAYVSVLAPLLLDQYMWNFPEGMLMVALAWGVAGVRVPDVP